MPRRRPKGRGRRSSFRPGARAVDSLRPHGLAGLDDDSAAVVAYLTERFRRAATAKDSVVTAMLGAWIVEARLSSSSSSSSSALAHFLAQNAKHLDADTTVRVLADHDAAALRYRDYAASDGDRRTAVSAALDAGGAADALALLNEETIEIAAPLYHRHAATLLARAPARTARSLLARYPHGLRPTRLLPALMHYERTRRERREERERDGLLAEGSER